MQTTESNRPLCASGLVVSIHDVSPATRERTEVMLRDLAVLGVERTSLLVIPDHHGAGRFWEDESFVSWLRAKVDVGHEAVVHGFYHRRDARMGESVWERIITRFYTAGEGEFFDLSEVEAAERLVEARGGFEGVGLNPVGFIAPAWLLGDAARRAVDRCGFAYTTTLGAVDDLEEGWRIESQSLVYSVRAGWRRQVSLIWNSALLRALQGRPLVRLGLHPPDWNYPAIRAHAGKCIRAALAGRDVMTYEGWLKRQRQNRVS